MEYQKAKEIAEKVIADGVNSITKDQETFARKVYKELNGKPFKGCTNCWNDLVILATLKIKSIQNPKPQTTMKKFILKPGKMIQLHGFDPITEKNCTDEVAMAILKVSKAHSKSFQSLPDGWEGMVDKYVPVKVKPAADAPKSKRAEAQIEAKKDAKAKEKTNANDDGNGDNGEEAANAQAAQNKAKADAKAKLEAMSKKELQEICETKDLPEAEYSKLNKTKLVDYILGKL